MIHPNTTPIEVPKKEQDTQTIAEKYFRMFFLPGFIAAIFAILAQFIENTFWVAIIAYLCLLIYIVWKLYEDKATPKIGFWTYFVSLLIITFFVALIKLAINFKFIYFLNLITEPLIYAILGGLVCYLIMLILSKAPQHKIKDNNKNKEIINK